MDKAVIQGCYVDLKFLPGLKSARVYIDIPIEHSNTFLKMFDAPDRANPVPVAIARLATSTAEQSSSPARGEAHDGQSVQVGGLTSTQTDKPRTPFKDLPRSQQAALKLRDPEFQQWVAHAYPGLWRDVPLNGSDRENAANQVVKHLLGIESKRELDSDPMRAAAWDRMQTTFDMRAYALGGR